jgi:hypothetical protein
VKYDADILVFCVPHQFMRGIVRQLKGRVPLLTSVYRSSSPTNLCQDLALCLKNNHVSGKHLWTANDTDLRRFPVLLFGLHVWVLLVGCCACDRGFCNSGMACRERQGLLLGMSLTWRLL